MFVAVFFFCSYLVSVEIKTDKILTFSRYKNNGFYKCSLIALFVRVTNPFFFPKTEDNFFSVWHSFFNDIKTCIICKQKIPCFCCYEFNKVEQWEETPRTFLDEHIGRLLSILKKISFGFKHFFLFPKMTQAFSQCFRHLHIIMFSKGLMGYWVKRLCNTNKNCDWFFGWLWWHCMASTKCITAFVGDLYFWNPKLVSLSIFSSVYTRSRDSTEV